MSVISIASQKGGVGKTTLALNLSYALAARHWKTLLIDTDPQGGVGLSLRGSSCNGHGLVELTAGQASLKDTVVATRLDNLHLLPFGHLDISRVTAWSTSVGSALHKIVGEAAQHYEAVLIDTPPGLSEPTASVLRVATHLVSPLQAEPLALRSVPQFLALIAQQRQEGHPLVVAGLVPTMVQCRERVCLDVIAEAFRLFPNGTVLEAFVPRDPIFLEASAQGVPLGLLHRRPPAVAAVFDRIAAELEPRLDLIDEDSHEPIPLLD